MGACLVAPMDSCFERHTGDRPVATTNPELKPEWTLDRADEWLIYCLRIRENKGKRQVL